MSLCCSLVCHDIVHFLCDCSDNDLPTLFLAGAPSECSLHWPATFPLSASAGSMRVWNRSGGSRTAATSCMSVTEDL